MRRPSLLALPAALLVAGAAAAQPAPSPYQSLGRDILRELVGTNTAYPTGGTTRAAELLAARFRAAGVPAADVLVVGPDSGTDAKDRNLVVRIRGRGARRPIILLGHLDVVAARREDWTRDPFTLTEQDGYYYGRGVLDMKSGDAAWTAALLRLRQEGVVPAGDYLLVLTAGEEGGGGYNGVEWLVQHRRDLLDAQYALNADMGGGELRGGQPVALTVLTDEKTSYAVRLHARNVGGHSSLPTRDNAIYEVADALGRIEGYTFPARTTPVTRAMLADLAAQETGAPAADLRALSAAEHPDSATAARVAARSPFLNAILRTTCVATQFQGGHAPNALPQQAAATVSCRILPVDDPATVRARVASLVGDTAVALETPATDHTTPSSPLPAALARQVQAVARTVWGPIPLVPAMATFATDGMFLRPAGIPSYGVSGIFYDRTEPRDMRAHGLDERIGVRAFGEQLEFTYRLLRAL